MNRDGLPGKSNASLLTGTIEAGWRRITARHLLVTAMLGVFLTPIHLTLGPQFFTLASPDPGVPRTMVVLMTLSGSEIEVFAFLVCLVFADEAVSRGATRSHAYAVAALAGALVASLLGWASFRYFFWAPHITEGDERWLVMVWPTGFLFLLAFGTGATILWADLRRRRESQERLQRAETARTERARIALGLRLNAMRARVEPQFLFDTLTRIRRSFDDDAARAERLLDGLVTYLRAAMPLVNHASSTVAGEIALARAYIDIVKTGCDGGLSSDIAVAEGLGDAQMPPMALLPLVQLAARSPGAGDSRSVELRVTQDDGRVRLWIGDSGDAFDPGRDDETSNVVAARLRAQYGSAARLELRRRAHGGSEAMMEFPHEPAHGGHR